MSFIKYISWKAFFLSFMVGLVFIYIIEPGTKTVLMYPTPSTVGKVFMKDSANNCFQYVQTLMSCPSDKSKISDIPVQIY
jgi:hypothetical protein